MFLSLPTEFSTYNTHHLYARRLNHLSVYFWQPAQALDIPLEIAASILYTFPSTLKTNGGHSSTLQPSAGRSLHSLATRLLVDREILINTLTTSAEAQLRFRLRDANVQAMDTWFEELLSPRIWVARESTLRMERSQFRRPAGIEGVSEPCSLRDWWCMVVLEKLFRALPAEDDEQGVNNGNVFKRRVRRWAAATFGSGKAEPEHVATDRVTACKVVSPSIGQMGTVTD